MTLSTAARNAATDAIATLLNGGSLQLATDGTFTTIVCTFTLATPAFGAASTGTATISAALTATASATGNAEAYRLRNSANADVITETGANAISATGGGGQLILNQANTSITSGQTVTINTATLSTPAA